MYFNSFSNPMQRGTKPCKFGLNCHFLSQGRCWFYHPAEHRQRKTYNSFGLSNSRNETSYSSFQSTLQRLIKQIVEQRQAKAKIELQKRLEEQARQRQREKQRQRLRQRQSQRQDLFRQRLLLMTNLRNQKKKWPSDDFEQLFSNNKSFKALEISEEKLQEIDQCIICFCSFWENSDEINHEEKCSENNCLESKEHLQKELTELYCRHTFHKACIKNWLKTNPKCPMCRKDFRDHVEYKKLEEEKKELKMELKKEEPPKRIESSLQHRFQLFRFQQ